MVQRVSVRRPVVVAVLTLGVLLLATAVVIWYRWATNDDSLTRMKPYAPEKQHERAEALVAALNSRDPARVELFRNHSAVPQAPADNARIDRNIKAAMPSPGCHYVLDSVHDDGEQGPQNVGWMDKGMVETYRYDMLVREICPDRSPIPVKIGVIAVPSGMGGYWSDAALAVEQ